MRSPREGPLSLSHSPAPRWWLNIRNRSRSGAGPTFFSFLSFPSPSLRQFAFLRKDMGHQIETAPIGRWLPLFFPFFPPPFSYCASNLFWERREINSEGRDGLPPPFFFFFSVSSRRLCNEISKRAIAGFAVLPSSFFFLNERGRERWIFPFSLFCDRCPRVKAPSSPPPAPDSGGRSME